MRKLILAAAIAVVGACQPCLGAILTPGDLPDGVSLTTVGDIPTGILMEAPDPTDLAPVLDEVADWITFTWSSGSGTHANISEGSYGVLLEFEAPVDLDLDLYVPADWITLLVETDGDVSSDVDTITVGDGFAESSTLRDEGGFPMPRFEAIAVTGATSLRITPSSYIALEDYKQKAAARVHAVPEPAGAGDAVALGIMSILGLWVVRKSG